jgi:hypothetical protein
MQQIGIDISISDLTVDIFLFLVILTEPHSHFLDCVTLLLMVSSHDTTTTTGCFYLIWYKHLTIYLPISTFSIIHAWPLIVRTFADPIEVPTFLDPPLEFPLFHGWWSILFFKKATFEKTAAFWCFELENARNLWCLCRQSSKNEVVKSKGWDSSLHPLYTESTIPIVHTPSLSNGSATSFLSVCSSLIQGIKTLVSYMGSNNLYWLNETTIRLYERGGEGAKVFTWFGMTKLV